MDTILIVDDSTFIVDGLIAFLKKKYRPLAAYGGAECLDILKRETPSVIILDIMMEPMDGWETLSRIKENPATRNIPVLMFSAIKISPEEAGSHRVSIDDCLTKPVSPNKIVEAIEKVLARRDTYRLITERWLAGGIPQEKIDQYLSLVANLEVDLSLCQNMRIQYDLLHPQDKTEADFQAMIKDIEERVLQERNRIETLGREMNETLEKGPVETGKPAGAGAVGKSGEPERAPVPAESLPETSSAEIGGSLPMAHPDPAPAAPTPGTPPETSPDLHLLPRDPGTGMPGDMSPPADSPVLTSPPSSDDTTSGIPAPEIVPPVPGQGEQGAVTPAEMPAPETIGTGQEPEPAAAATSIPGTPPTRPAAADQRNVIPADPDLPLIRGDFGTSSPPGAGTDIPMPWGLPAERKPHEIAGRPEKKTPGTGAPANSGGLLARVLSFVRSIFRKP